jgi:branched-chain amino acid transport system permease protein
MRFWTVSLLVVLSVIGIALSDANNYFFFAGFVVLQAVVLASAWNILGGYAGYVNFGVPAFVGAGAYTALSLHLSFEAPLVIQILAGAIFSGAVGFLVGLLTVRLRGIFFSIATVSLVFIFETLVMNSSFLGGATGHQLTRPSDIPFFDTYTRYLVVVMVVLAVISVAAARFIQDSFVGRGLRAVRDSEEAAECSLLGAAGAPMPMYLSYIEPASTFNLLYAVSALAMPIIGGMSHWIGPVIGALILATLQQIVTVTISSEMNVLVVGVLLVFFVVVAPDGILGLIKRWKASSK